MCLARILAPPNSEIKITFGVFDVEYATDCWFDAVEVSVFIFKKRFQNRIHNLIFISVLHAITSIRYLLDQRQR